MTRLSILLLLLFVSLPPDGSYASSQAELLTSNIMNDSDAKLSNETFSHKRVKVLEIRWESVHTVYIITLWLLLASVAKIIFHNLEQVTSIFPESSLLIVVGILIGYVLQGVGVSVENYRLDSHAFFIYLLPPIIFDAGYFMPNRAFFQNYDSIMLFAVVGTCFNAAVIGACLWGFAQLDIFTISFSTFEILTFSSLISAVDPVAVIAVFEEIHVNDFIFVNVFGEALFNDGVTVVLYELFAAFLEMGDSPIQPIDYASGIAYFFIIAGGGAIVGILFAFLAAILTKYTVQLRVLAPLFIFLVPYMSYLTAELLSLSPIIAIAICGMGMKQYVKGNITPTAANSVKYFTKMLAQSCETVIFMFLGLSTISADHHWDTGFVCITILLCLVVRIIAVFLQCGILNRFRSKRFSVIDQFILCYGGLRGAIAFGLAASLPQEIAAKPMFITTTIAVIYFTVFLQGSTIRPLVSCLNVERKTTQEPTMAESVYVKYLDYLMSGVEDIAGQKGHYSLIDNFERLNSKVLCPILMHNHSQTPNFDATKIVRAYAKLILRDAMSATNLPAMAMAANGNKASGTLHPRVGTLQGDAKRNLRPGTPTAFACECQQNKKGEKVIFHQPTCPLSQPEMASLYSLFGEMLDKKLDNLRQELGKVNAREEDIGDDYITQVARHGSTMSLADTAIPSDEEVDPSKVLGQSFNLRRRTMQDNRRRSFAQTFSNFSHR